MTVKSVTPFAVAKVPPLFTSSDLGVIRPTNKRESMESNIESMKKELAALREKGNHLYLAMLDDVQGLPDDFKKKLKKDKIKLPSFNRDYNNQWGQTRLIFSLSLI